MKFPPHNWIEKGDVALSSHRGRRLFKSQLCLEDEDTHALHWMDRELNNDLKSSNYSATMPLSKSRRDLKIFQTMNLGAEKYQDLMQNETIWINHTKFVDIFLI